MKTKCAECGKELTGGIDTFDSWGDELCWDCYAERNGNAGQEMWYGLAPHQHAFDEHGNIIIGGTTFDPLPMPNENGVYDFGDSTFIPDPEADGCGIWQRKPLKGWL